MEGEAQRLVTMARATSAKLTVISLDQLLSQDTFFKKIYSCCTLCLLYAVCLNICADAFPPSFLEEDLSLSTMT